MYQSTLTGRVSIELAAQELTENVIELALLTMEAELRRRGFSRDVKPEELRYRIGEQEWVWVA